MRKALLSSTVTLALVLAAGPTLAIDIGAGLGGGGSAGASSGGSGGSVGGSASAEASVNSGSSASHLGSSTSALGSIAGSVSGAASASQTEAAGAGSVTTAASTGTTNASGDIAMEAISLAEGLTGEPVISADGARVGSVVGIGIDASGQPASIHTKIGGFLGIGSTPVQFPIGITTITEQHVQLDATQAQLSAFIQAQKNASVSAGNGAASADVASNATAGVAVTAAQ